ncbi:MAG TPA: HD domain-containing phosphohydrolase [Syntrophomonadaceae bacterium]|nr:HD domain-containing phosphohydrolase [Syntrophomonadaceae bacterium]
MSVYQSRSSKELPSSFSHLQNRIYDYDADLYYHCQKVASNSMFIGQIMKLSRKRASLLFHAALLHDVGKILLPKDGTHKTSGLTEDKRNLLCRHPEDGCELIAAIAHPETVELIPIVLSHHEWVDGSGYPCGLKGRAIPVEARIIAIADAIDNMTTINSQKEEVATLPRAIIKIVSQAGCQFDEEIVDRLADVYKDIT